MIHPAPVASVLGGSVVSNFQPTIAQMIHDVQQVLAVCDAYEQEKRHCAPIEPFAVLCDHVLAACDGCGALTLSTLVVCGPAARANWGNWADWANWTNRAKEAKRAQEEERSGGRRGGEGSAIDFGQLRLRPALFFDFGQFRLRPISTSANFDFGQFRLRPIFGC